MRIPNLKIGVGGTGQIAIKEAGTDSGLAGGPDAK
jgi:hypothetical protein